MRGPVTRRLGAAAGNAALLVLAAAAFGPVALAADQTVDIVGFSFSPASVTVVVGDTVTWTNADAQSHTATADGGAFDTGTIGGNSSQAVTLTTAGTFAYHCTIHPAMTATLVVTAAGAPPATDTEVGAAGSGLPWAALLLGVTIGVWVAIERRRPSGRRHVANQSPQDS
jgi:plastocyanin